MFPTVSTTQVITPFGSGYVPLLRGEPTKWNLARVDVDDVVESFRPAMFEELMKSLRSALYLK